jgi:hypothetical protein
MTTEGESIALSIWQNFADCKGKIFPVPFGQNPAVAIDYRKALRENLRVLLALSGKSRDTIKARYVAGPKKGEILSSRTVGYVLSGAEGTSGLSVDGLGALATALGIEAYHLLVPGLDPLTHPVTRAETWIEAEVERRLAARLKRAGALLKTLEVDEEARPSARNPWPDIKAPAKHGKRKATQKSSKRGVK